MAAPAGELDALPDVLSATFPAGEDAPMALALLRDLSRGEPVAALRVAALAAELAPADADATARLAAWSNLERDEHESVIGFAGLTLRNTPHALLIGRRRLHTWCAWDTLFLPALLDVVARAESSCPLTGALVQLRVGPGGVHTVRPKDSELFVSFPQLSTADPANVTGSFCRHVFLLAGRQAKRRWSGQHPDGHVLDLADAVELGRRTVAPLLAAISDPSG